MKALVIYMKDCIIRQTPDLAPVLSKLDKSIQAMSREATVIVHGDVCRVKLLGMSRKYIIPVKCQDPKVFSDWCLAKVQRTLDADRERMKKYC